MIIERFGPPRRGPILNLAFDNNYCSLIQRDSYRLLVIVVQLILDFWFRLVHINLILFDWFDFALLQILLIILEFGTRIRTERDRLCNIFELKVQFFREKFYVSFHTNETCLRWTISKYERKVVCYISASRRKVFYNYLITRRKHVKKMYKPKFAVQELISLKELSLKAIVHL